MEVQNTDFGRQSMISEAYARKGNAATILLKFIFGYATGGAACWRYV